MVVKEQTKMSDLCWKVCDRAQSYYGSETLCKNYETETFLLVSCSDRSKQLLWFIITFSFCFVNVKKRTSQLRTFFISMHYETTKESFCWYRRCPLSTLIAAMPSLINQYCSELFAWLVSRSFPVLIEPL